MNMTEHTKTGGQPQLEKLKQTNKECEYCNGYGILVRNNDYKEDYGEPYRPPTQKCLECGGIGWVVK